MRALLAGFAALALVLVACSGNGSAAEDALRRHLGYLDKGQFGRAYDEIHPAQKGLFSRDDYVKCAEKQSSGVEIEKIRILETYKERLTIPGTSTAADSVAITAEITVRAGSLRNTSTDTFHEYLVDGRWLFAVRDPSDYQKC